MTLVAVIGGSGLTELKCLKIERRQVLRTPFGEPSAPMVYGRIGGREAVFLPRHGPGHTIPPHAINYRANVWALKEIGATHVIAVAAVGSIAERLDPGELMLPDQIIDYTWGRAHTFYTGESGQVRHIDFTQPYSENLRRLLMEAARSAQIALASKGVYAATQGPRFETAAEISRLERDGADVVGMTGMPEVALARELDLDYATIAVVANRAAGKTEGKISLEEIRVNLERGMTKVRALLEWAIPNI